MKKTNQGFTLIELMLVVGILGILAAVAYPNYTEYVQRSNRSEGQAQLNDIAARQERYFSQNNTYVTDPANLALLGLPVTNNKIISPTRKYELTVASVAGDGGYTLTAEQQFGDSKCDDLVLNARGIRGAAGKLDSGSATDKKKVAACWR